MLTIGVLAGDPLALQPPVRWALDELRGALRAGGVATQLLTLAPPDGVAGVDLLVGGPHQPVVRALLEEAGARPPVAPESLALATSPRGSRPVTIACGADVRGLVYAVLELVDRAEHASGPALQPQRTIEQQPALRVRSVTRCFTSERYDKSWLRDEGFWRRYLSMLARQRFNRFSLTLGLGYNLPRHVTDAYLYFAYPFLVEVPGFDVHVSGLPPEERERNLEALRFIGREATRRGLDFQLGLWTHAWTWVDSPSASHAVQGLTPETHAAYCRDALRAVLDSCRDISGVTLRTHGESGIAERSSGFWETVFDGVAGCGRRVGLDLHAKGLDEATLDAARATGMPLTVSPKYWAEHMGLPYHQAAIRDLERPPDSARTPETDWERFMAVSVVSRPHTRYGYGDFLREDRDFDVVHRIWPGTQRLLLWGDPAMAAGYGRHASVAGSAGLEWFEPLTFRGREGSGVPGRRDGYADPALVESDDWRKHEYAYRLMGRLTYDPDEDHEVWGRSLRRAFGPASHHAEAALAHASRILPLVTVAHHPSASNNSYWPELYTDMPIARGGPEDPAWPYFDTPLPRRFATVSPLDPELFCGVDAFVGQLLAGEVDGRYTPLDVASWLSRLSHVAAEQLGALSAAALGAGPAVRRLVVDVGILEALGRFFAGKLRAATLHELATRTGSREARAQAQACHLAARAAWCDAARLADGVYAEDLTFGRQPWLRGNWWDRLPAIDEDIEALATEAAGTAGIEARDIDVRALMERAGARPSAGVRHEAPPAFRRGSEIPLALSVEPLLTDGLDAVVLRYRRVNQAERWTAQRMVRQAAQFTAVIPGEATDSPFPVQYRFVIWDHAGRAWPYPGLGDDFSSQPYFVLRQAVPARPAVTPPS